MSQARVPFGVRQAVEVSPVRVDLEALIYDRDRQVNFVRDGGVLVPALRHSTGTTSTNTSSSDARPGNDSDQDHTED
jgi:putative ATP-grasp target RiPP